MGLNARRQGWDGRRFGMESLEKRRVLASDLELLKDINETPLLAGSGPNGFVSVGSIAYFVATTPEHGRELWRTDGTEAGTTLVKNIGPGESDGTVRSLTNVAGVLYFVANDGSHGNELWKSDGTESGTMMVSDIIPGATASQPTELTNFNGQLFFTAARGPKYATDSSNDRGLWTSDGATTTLVKSLTAASGLNNQLGTMYFGDNGRLWKSDGTGAGTTIVATTRFIRPAAFAHQWAEANGVVYFSAASSSTSNYELWRTDGTDAGTYLVKDIYAGGSSSSPANLINIGGTLYFQATDAANGRELWRSDGTTAGTTLLKDFTAGAGNTFLPPQQQLPPMLEHDGKLVVAVGGMTSGFPQAEVALWTSDGTPAGTTRATTIPFSRPDGAIRWLTSVDGEIYFMANQSLPAPDFGTGVELWKLDDSVEGAAMVVDLYPGRGSSGPSQLFNHNGTILFSAFTPETGPELFRSDGTAAGTSLVKDMAIANDASTPSYYLQEGQYVYFRADDGVHGAELWRSDGTAAGTALAFDVRPGAEGSFVSDLRAIGGRLYFSAQTSDTTEDYFRLSADGTTLERLREIWPWYRGTLPVAAAFDGAGFFFHSYETEGDWQLWSTDGTEAGTQLLADLSAAPYSDDSPSWSIIAASDAYYFHVRTLASSYELWRSDGTPTGTHRLLAPEDGVEFGAVSNFTQVGDVAYFTRLTAWDGALSLWRTDGSPEGTVRVGDIPRKGVSWEGPELVNFNGTLYFTAAPTEGAYSLVFWKVTADGAGVELALRLPSFWDAELYHPHVHQGSLYFHAYSPGGDDGVWRTDGTAAGTVHIKYIRNVFGNYLNSFTPVGESLYFSVNESVIGYKRLWQTDGTEAGTVEVSPMLVEAPFNADGVLFLQGTTGPIGSEPYVRRSDAGDYNADDRIDGADFLIWQRRAGSSTVRGGFGDGNLDGMVDGSDLAIWAAEFGEASGTATTSASKFAVAALMADEESSTVPIGFSAGAIEHSRVSASAADAAFAWLAADRREKGDDYRSGSATDAKLRDWVAQLPQDSVACATQPAMTSQTHLVGSVGKPEGNVHQKQRRIGNGQSTIADECDARLAAFGLAGRHG